MQIEIYIPLFQLSNQLRVNNCDSSDVSYQDHLLLSVIFSIINRVLILNKYVLYIMVSLYAEILILSLRVKHYALILFRCFYYSVNI